MVYKFPKLDLLEYHNPENDFTDMDYVKALGVELENVLDSFKVKCSLDSIRMSPFAVLFDIVPSTGTSVKDIQSLRVELEVYLASPVEIANIGEKKYTVGIAIKKWDRPTIGLRDIMETDEFKNNDFSIPIAAGMNVMGKPFVFDLAATPHLLVAGATGSGKSIFLNDIVMSIVYTKSPEDVKFIMIDPKGVELTPYNGIPHMLMPVITESEKAFAGLKWVDEEMRRRYKSFADFGVKNIESFNKAVSPEIRLPRIVIVVDEYMEMMFQARKNLEMYIDSLSRLGRASGIHLVLSTQRPSSDVITSNIKSNIPCRASFTVVDWRESKTILDRTGAERLLGNGDMLYSLGVSSMPVHAQASFVSYDEIDRVIAAISK